MRRFQICSYGNNLGLIIIKISSNYFSIIALRDPNSITNVPAAVDMRWDCSFIQKNNVTNQTVVQETVEKKIASLDKLQSRQWKPSLVGTWERGKYSFGP